MHRIYVLVLACILAFSGCSDLSLKPEPVRIGLIASLSGKNEPNGRAMEEAATLAVEQINQDGGIRVGRKMRQVALVVRDDRNTPEDSVEAARFLIHREEVAAIVGPQLSRNAIPAAQIAEETGIPMICPMSTSPLTTSGKSYVFRIPYLDGFQGTVMAYFARRELEARTAAVLFDVANVYNREIAEVFKDEFSSLGGRITAFERYTTDDNTDFSKQLSRIRQTAPDVLYLPNYAADVQRQAEQARSLGLESVLLGSDGWSDTMFQSEPAFNGSFMTRHWHPEISSPQSKQFFRAYSDRFGREPDDVAATTYDAFSLLFAAVELAGSSDPPEIQKNLYLLDEFQGVTGTIDYRENGDPVKSAIIIEIRDGENHFYSEVKPSSSMVDHG